MKSKMKSRGIAMLGGALAIVAGSLMLAAPAQALGSFNVKLTATGCTEGDYYGQSVRYGEGAIWDIRATTSYTHPICVANSVGARAIGPSSASPWEYNLGTVVVYLNVGTTYPASGAGQHSVNDNYTRNT